MGKTGLLAQEGAFHVNFTAGENLTLVVILAISLLGLLVAYVLVRQVLAADQGGEKMREVSLAIQEGSRAYLTRQFRTVAIFVALLFFLLLVLEADSTSVRIGRSVAFLFGAGFSALAGFTGMSLTVRGNVRVAAAADSGGMRRAMPLAFRTGGVAGMPVVGLMFPLLIQAIGIMASVAGIWLVRPRSEDESGMRIINRGFFAAALIAAALVAVVTFVYVDDWRPLAAVALGIVLAAVIQLMTSYYTATQYKPVQEIADASESGPATTILAGFA